MQRLWYFKAMSTVTPTLFLTICDLLSFLFCLLIMLGDGPSFHGCQVPHLPWHKISRKGVKSQAKMTHLWTQVSKGDSSPWQQERSQYPMCGALLCRKEWGVGKQANWEQSPRVVILQEKTSCSTLAIAQPHPFTFYLLPEENFRYQLLWPSMTGFNLVFSRLSQTLYT